MVFQYIKIVFVVHIYYIMFLYDIFEIYNFIGNINYHIG
jgi:hypothetical protein